MKITRTAYTSSEYVALESIARLNGRVFTLEASIYVGPKGDEPEFVSFSFRTGRPGEEEDFAAMTGDGNVRPLLRNIFARAGDMARVLQAREGISFRRLEVTGWDAKRSRVYAKLARKAGLDVDTITEVNEWGDTVTGVYLHL